MITDRRPRGKKKCAEYAASSEQGRIHVPRSTDMTALANAIDNAMVERSREAVRKACTDLLQTFSEFYGIARPSLKIIAGPRPHETLEGRLASELFGDYTFESAVIRLWLRTPMKEQWTSTNTFLSTLCHEFMHHVDATQLGFSNSYHTIGFFERTHRLYLAATGSPYFPLAWDLISDDGSKNLASVVAAINWPETNRAKARVLARTARRGKSPRRRGQGDDAT